MDRRLGGLALVAVAAAASPSCGGGGGGGGGGAPPDPPLPFLTLSTFQNAAVVVGQSGPTGSAPNAGGAGPNAVGLGTPYAAVGGALFVPDRDNHRVLGFTGVPTSDGAPATFVLGQTDLGSNTPGTSATKLRYPLKAVVARGKLFVADGSNSRVLIWNGLPDSNGEPADVVVGQPDFSSSTPATTRAGLAGPSGIAVADGRLYVADTNNHRVLVWDSIPTSNGQPADRVLGQVDFTSGGAGTSDYQLNGPGDVAVGGGKLFVADTLNHRVMGWNTAPPPFGLADFVLGQPGFVTAIPAAGADGMFWPIGVHASDSQLFVADYGNNRVLVFDTLPTMTLGETADKVLGQSSFTNVAPNDDDQDGTPGAASARTMNNPTGVSGLGSRLFVTEAGNHRVVVFESP
jgi:hypothetical protein